MGCLDDNTVAAFFEGKLAPDARGEVEAHVDSCSACRQLVAGMAAAIRPSGIPTKADSPAAGGRGDAGAFPRPGESPPFVEGQAPLHEGQVIADRFRLGAQIGHGGMGTVYAATHVQLGHRLAIKVLSPLLAGDPEGVRRFLNEARAAAHIASEHVVRVIDVGTLPGGAPFLAMEYLDGEDLGDLVERRGRLPVEEAVDLVLEALEGLAHAHALGIVHRDLKNANLFVARRTDGTRCVKVLDFGISKIDASLGAPREKSTVTGMALGTPHYMAPEQLRNSKSVDARADIWAVGVILYRLLTGDLPFEGESMAELILSIGSEGRPSLRTKRPEIPAELESVVLRALARDLGERWSDAASLAAALAPFGSAASRGSARRVSQVLGQSGAHVRSEAPPRGRGRRWVVPSLGALGVTVAIAALALNRGRSGTDANASTAAPTSTGAPSAAAPAAAAASAGPGSVSIVGTAPDAAAVVAVVAPALPATSAPRATPAPSAVRPLRTRASNPAPAAAKPSAAPATSASARPGILDSSN